MELTLKSVLPKLKSSVFMCRSFKKLSVFACEIFETNLFEYTRVLRSESVESLNGRPRMALRCKEKNKEIRNSPYAVLEDLSCGTITNIETVFQLRLNQDTILESSSSKYNGSSHMWIL